VEKSAELKVYSTGYAENTPPLWADVEQTQTLGLA
jgi:hypothetical protein